MNMYVLFHTHSDAIKFEKKMKSIDLVCTLMPVPRKFSSSCGVCGKMIFKDNFDKNLFNGTDKVYLEDGTLFFQGE
jgi:hypothetical protein